MPANGIDNYDEPCCDETNILSSGVESGGSEDESLAPSSDKSVRYTQLKDNNTTNIQQTNRMDANRYASLPNRAQHERFLRNFIEEVMQLAVFNATDRSNKVLEWTNPEDLINLFDMSLKSTPDSDEKLMELTRDTIKYSVKTGHPYFVNQLFSAVDPYALAGQWLTDALNPSVYTYEVAPVFILMEEVVLKEMRSIVGWKDGDGDGIFCPGGSIANGYAIQCARFKYMPDVKVS